MLKFEIYISIFRLSLLSNLDITNNSGTNVDGSGSTGPDSDSWKRRNISEDRHIIRQGPPKQPDVPPPTQHHHINRYHFLIAFIYFSNHFVVNLSGW